MNCPVVVIIGPTASGKSKLALEMATKFNGAIISADSWVVRKHLDIGTSKPSLEDRAIVDHYMIDIIDVNQDFSAAAYKQQATAALETIIKQGQLPFIVGGSGLYVDSLIYDYSFSPPGEVSTRQKLNLMTLAELHDLANNKGLDLNKIDRRNKRRVIRLIETNGAEPKRGLIRDNTLMIGINPTNEELDSAIRARVEQMIKAGLIDEVETLSKSYGWDSEGMKGIGYKEWQLYFLANQSLELTQQRIIRNSLALAKRQKTWFKRNKSIHWFTTPVNYDEVEDLITTFVNKNIS